MGPTQDTAGGQVKMDVAFSNGPPRLQSDSQKAVVNSLMWRPHMVNHGSFICSSMRPIYVDLRQFTSSKY